MKKGDIVYCKKDYKYDIGSFMRGNFYEIESIHISDGYWINLPGWVYVYTRGMVMVKILLKDFNHYFCTKQQGLRKEKLKQLSNYEN